MQLPGMAISAQKVDIAEFINTLNTVFLPGGLTLSQISTLGNLRMHDIQNWIKRGFCKSPVDKKYDKKQFCRLVTINILKDSMTISDITSLISYVNGIMDDESDDIIPDDMLYCIFAYSVLSDNDSAAPPEYLNDLGDDERRRVLSAIAIMKKAYLSTKFRSEAYELMEASGIKNGGKTS